MGNRVPPPPPTFGGVINETEQDSKTWWPHSPHNPTPEWIDKFKGQFDMGWNAMREQIFANQKRLGVIPANAQLTPWPDDLPKWDTLDADSTKLFARQTEVFAAYTAYTDHEIGRVIQAVEDMGKLDNTLVITCR
jgi:arylsulfatase